MLGGATDDVSSLSVRGNSITGCEVGIGVAREARGLSITKNTIAGASKGAIRAFDRYRPIGPDLAQQGTTAYPNLNLSGNVVR